VQFERRTEASATRRASSDPTEFEQRFAGRARMVESMPGFVRLEILRPMQSDYYIVPTHWKDEVSFRAWTMIKNPRRLCRLSRHSLGNAL
jgi:heme-degrading monooxygenase HmoA